MASTTTPQRANSPFNKPSADAILRTVDGIDFYVHTQILCLVSPMFESMFSIPQPHSEALSKESTPPGPSQPIIELSEDSSTIEHVLRFCYPVPDPIVDDFATLDHILAAASKYDLEIVTLLARPRLSHFLESHPLATYTVACIHGFEEIARGAADIWKGKRRDWADALPNFKDTLTALSYDSQLMTKRLSAGQFFRLLEFLRGKQIPAFCKSSEPIKQHSAEQQPKIMAMRYPFNLSNADIDVRSLDGQSFRVHTAVIELQFADGTDRNATVWSIFSVPRPHEDSKEYLPILETDIPGDSLLLLLKLCYPLSPNDQPLLWGVAQLTSPTFIRMAQAALRYGFRFVREQYMNALRERIPSDPISVFCACVELDQSAITKEAAQELALLPLQSLWAQEMEDLPAEHYYVLLSYYHSVQLAIHPIINRHRGQTTNYVFPDKSLATTYGKATSRIWSAQMINEIDRAVHVHSNSWRSYSNDVVSISLQNAALEKDVRLALSQVEFVLNL